MGMIGVNSDGNLYFDFEYQGIRCLEYTSLVNTSKNRQLMNDILQRIEGEISLGIFDYYLYFPKSENAEKFSHGLTNDGAVFVVYAENWYKNNKISWKPSFQRVVRSTLDRHLIPYFMGFPVTAISKWMIKEFRTALAQLDGRKGRKIGNTRINNIMDILRMVMNEAVEEYEIKNPFSNLKSLKARKPDIMPLSMDEIFTFLKYVKAKYHDYYVVRFFTGMRTAEIDGLKWKYVDFAAKTINVRETWENREWVSPKTESSSRDIEMSTIVEEALKRQRTITGDGEIVFPTRSGKPLDHDDITRRIWYPTLKKAGLAPRAPYQSRHTAASLWIASGESPEWIARQLGHANTMMLFKVYSKFVPNLTRKDGSAFEMFIEKRLNAELSEQTPIQRKDKRNDE